MNKRDIGRLVRLLRQRRFWTQDDLAARAGVAKWKVVKLEAGEIDALRTGDVEKCLAAFDARLWITATYHGAAAERLFDELHARLVAACVRVLTRLGWEVHVEVSFNEYGDRGSIDILALHSATSTLLVIEVKSELPGIDVTLRPLDVKVRVATAVARNRFGWKPATVARVLVLPTDRTVRRQVERHSAVLRAALPSDAREVRRWLRKPTGPMAGIWFVSDGQHSNVKRNPSAVRRVRRQRPRSGSSADGAPSGSEAA